MKCIYDLWHGTIESQDGALQLLQIVDYIWTWARDIYRPQMRHCLRTIDGREPTPVFPSRIHRSLSAQTESSNYSATDPRSSEVELEERNNYSRQYIDSLPDIAETNQITPAASVQYKSHPHPFLRWATLHNDSPHLASFATIRHADLVSSSFYIREIPNIETYLSTFESSYTRKERLRLIDMYRFSILISRRDLHHLESYWTGCGNWVPFSSETVKVTLFYHTYLQNTSWHIVKELVCIIWPHDEIDEEALLDRHTEPAQAIDRACYQWLEHGIQPVKQLQGSHSVLCAFNNYVIIPVFRQFQPHRRKDPDMIWVTPDQFFPSDSNVKECIELLQDDGLFAVKRDQQSSYFDADTTMAMIDSMDNDVDRTTYLPGLPEKSHETNSLIFVKPNDWPSTTPKFCLFVLLREHFDDAKVLENLLQQRLRSGEILGHSLELTKSDTSGLKGWLFWLRTLSPEYDPIVIS